MSAEWIEELRAWLAEHERTMPGVMRVAPVNSVQLALLLEAVDLVEALAAAREPMQVENYGDPLCLFCEADEFDRRGLVHTDSCPWARAVLWQKNHAQ